jgi:hypothetical protein
MANVPAYVAKTLRMKLETAKVFDDLDAWLDHCRFNLLNYDPKDLYRSRDYKDFVRYGNGGGDRRPYRKEYRPNNRFN